jgi:hypothetical protein
MNAVVAYVSVMAILITITHRSGERLNWYLVEEAATIARIALIWGVVGVAWSAVRTTSGDNQAGPIAKFSSYGIMLLLAAAFVFIVTSDVRRITG